MSHVANIMTKGIAFDLDIIKELCIRQGWQFMEGQKTFRWYGRFMGDAPVAEGMSVKDYGKCNHAIRIPGCNYEIGLRQTYDGKWNVVADFWRSGGLSKFLGDQGEIFSQLYNMTNDIMWAESKGYTWEEVESEIAGNKKLVIYQQEW